MACARRHSHALHNTRRTFLRLLPRNQAVLGLPPPPSLDVTCTFELSLTGRFQCTRAGSLEPSAHMQRGAKGRYCSKNNNGVLKEFIPRTASDADAIKVRDQCEAHCLEVAACQHCSVHCASGNSWSGVCQWNAIPTCGTTSSFAGKLAGDTSTKIGVCLVCPPRHAGVSHTCSWQI